MAYVPPGLSLDISVRLVDSDLSFSHANCLVVHDGFRQENGSISTVNWRLDTDEGWELISPEPDELIARSLDSHGSGIMAHEVQYGLRSFAWESYGFVVVTALKFPGLIDEILRGLGFPNRKILVSSFPQPSHPTSV